MCAGVGKTYDMLTAAHEAISKGIDVVIGIVETHKRPETEALAANLPFIPRKKIDYRDSVVEEMDLDAILARKPKLDLVANSPTPTLQEAAISNGTRMSRSFLTTASMCIRL